MAGEESIVDTQKNNEQLLINRITVEGGTQSVEEKVKEIGKIAEEALIELLLAIVRKKIN